MPTYKLTYFNSRGAAEVSRLIFALVEQEYEDIRVERSEWEKLKPETPLGQLPILNVDGKVLPQSLAINRFLARKFNLYGENDWEKAEIDAVLEVVQDLFYPVRKMFYADTDELKARYKKEFVDVQEPKYCGFLEKLLKANNGGDGFFVGSKVSLADIVVFAAVGDALGDKSRDYYLDHKEPKLKALIERIRAIPQINTWLQTRPKTEL